VGDQFLPCFFHISAVAYFGALLLGASRGLIARFLAAGLLLNHFLNEVGLFLTRFLLHYAFDEVWMGLCMHLFLAILTWFLLHHCPNQSTTLLVYSTGRFLHHFLEQCALGWCFGVLAGSARLFSLLFHHHFPNEI